MNIPTDIAALTALFEKLGAKEPDIWANSHTQENIPQFQRFLFLRQAWQHVLDEDNTTWIEQRIQNAELNPNAPYAGIGHALKNCIQQGIAPQDLTAIARGVQAEMLFNLCYLLENPAFSESELQNFAWGLFEVDENDNPLPPRIGALHESVLETDPTGREMRPNNTLLS